MRTLGNITAVTMAVAAAALGLLAVRSASVLNSLFGTDPLRVTALGISQAPWNHHRIDSVMATIEYAAGDGVPKLAQTHDAFAVPFPGTSMEVHGEKAPSSCTTP